MLLLEELGATRQVGRIVDETLGWEDQFSNKGWKADAFFVQIRWLYQIANRLVAGVN